MNSKSFLLFASYELVAGGAVRDLILSSVTIQGLLVISAYKLQAGNSEEIREALQ